MLKDNRKCYINDIGRIVIPIKLRKQLEISLDSNIEIFLKNGSIHMKKFSPTCVICNSKGILKSYKEKNICLSCINDII